MELKITDLSKNLVTLQLLNNLKVTMSNGVYGLLV